METQYPNQRIIKDIKNNDGQIQITGYIEELVGDSHFVLNDKTGKIKVLIKNINFTSEEEDLVNVIGDLNINTKGNKEIQAVIIQDMNKLNFKYYLKLYELKKELE